MNDVGLGQVVLNGGIRVFIANRPPLDIYQKMDDCLPMVSGEIAEIAQLTGNHWRKIFNVYAKVMFALLGPCNQLPSDIDTWQGYRDKILLRDSSQTALLFSKPNLSALNLDQTQSIKPKTINLLMGKQYAASLGFDRDQNTELQIIDGDFAVVESKNLIICPYFDYRQLSNIKIERLIKLIHKLNGV